MSSARHHIFYCLPVNLKRVIKYWYQSTKFFDASSILNKLINKVSFWDKTFRKLSQPVRRVVSLSLKWCLMLVSMSGDCCECVMTLTLTMSLTSREHQRVTRTGVTRGGRWQETQLWQRAGHRIRLQQRQSPWTTTRKQHNWHCAPQVPCQCPGPQHPGLCVWSWLIWKYLQSENMINCLLSGLHHHSYPSLNF